MTHPDKVYWFLVVNSREDRLKFIKYLKKADPVLLKTAKKEFPWKFDSRLKKGTILKKRRKNNEELVKLYDARLTRDEASKIDVIKIM